MFGRPGPSSSTQISTRPSGGASSPRRDAAARLERGVDRVAHEVDEELLELVGVGRTDDVGPVSSTPTDRRVSRAATRRSKGRHRHALEPRRRQAGQPRVGVHEARERVRARSAMIARPAPHVLVPVRRARRRARRGSPRLPAMDLMGASELLSSWPSTRMSRCHAWRSSSRSARLTSASTSSSMGQAALAERAAADLAAARRSGKASVEDPRASRRRSASSRPSSVGVVRPGALSVGWPSRRSPARLTSRSAPLAVEGEDRDVDLLHAPCAAGPSPRGRPGAARAGSPPARSPRRRTSLSASSLRRLRARNEKSSSRRAPSRFETVCSGRTTALCDRAGEAPARARTMHASVQRP